MDSIYFLIAILVFVFVVVVLGVFTKTIISKRGVFYSAPLLIYMFIIYVVGYKHTYGSLDFIGAFNCLVAAIKSFTFEIRSDYVINLINEDTIYAASLYIGVICSGFTLVFGVLEVFKVAIYNGVVRLFRLAGFQTDIVLGYNEDAINYCKSNKKTVLWIDSTIIKLSKEEKMKLYNDGIIYIYAPFTAKRLASSTFFILREVYVICFQKDNEYIPTILKTLEELKSFRKNLEFHVQTKSDHLTFINEQLTKRCVNKKNIIATSFDYYELIGRKFSLEHNLAMYLPKGFIEDGVVTPISADSKETKNINVVMLGFGKTSKAILKSIIMNNQFVQVVDNKYKCKKINLEIYDKSEEVFNDSLITHIEKFPELCKEDYFDFDPFLGPLELTVEMKHKKCDVKSDASEDFLKSIIKKKNNNDFTFYIIGLSSSVDNSLVAEMLSKIVPQSSSIIFYNIDAYNERLLSDSKICIPFGFKNDILSHDNITVEDIFTLAKLNNDEYNRKSGKNNDFFSIPIIEKLSNIYKEINLRFKLNLIGLDYTKDPEVKGLRYKKDKGDVKSEEKVYLDYCNPSLYHLSLEEIREKELEDENSEYSKLIKEDTEESKAKAEILLEEKKYAQYFNLNLGNALIYQEHLRWAMYYFLYDYRGMKLSDIYFDGNGKVVHKDIPNRKHACITSFEGADKLHRYELQMYLDAGKDKKISQVETFQYDMKLDTAYEELEQLEFKIIELKR